MTAYLNIIEKRSEDFAPIYNVGSGQQSTLEEVVMTCRDLLGMADTPTWGTMPQRQWDTNIWVSDIQKMRHHYNWQPRYTLKAGLGSTIQWIQTHPEIRQRYEQEILGRDL